MPDPNPTYRGFVFERSPIGWEGYHPSYLDYDPDTGPDGVVSGRTLEELRDEVDEWLLEHLGLDTCPERFGTPICCHEHCAEHCRECAMREEQEQRERDLRADGRPRRGEEQR